MTLKDVAKLYDSINCGKHTIHEYYNENASLDVYHGVQSGKQVYYGTLGLSDVLDFELVLFSNNAQANHIIADASLAMKEHKTVIDVFPTALVNQDDEITSAILRHSSRWFSSSPMPIYQLFEMTTRDAVLYQNLGSRAFWSLYDDKALPYNDFWLESDENSIVVGRLLYEQDYSLTDFKNDNKAFDAQYLGTSILLASILGGHTDIANHILDNQLEDVNSLDDYGDTLLHYLFKSECYDSALIAKVSTSFTRWGFKNMFGVSVNDLIKNEQSGLKYYD